MLAALLACGVLLINACGSDSDGGNNDNDDDDDDIPNTTIGRAISDADSMDGDAQCGGDVGTFTGLTFDHDGNAGTAPLNVCTIAGRITESVTLSNTVVWQLNGLVSVGFGNLAVEQAADVAFLRERGVTLTIEPGTLFRNVNQSALIITSGSKIEADGTADAPIIMTSNNGTSFNGSGQWGGLVLQGFGLHNACNDEAGNNDALPTSPVCNIAGEGAVGFFGGNDNSDDSGTLRYLVVAKGGFAVAQDNELNGITFQGVGNGTTVDFIQVHNNSDDGVEFFGGAVNAKHVVLTANEDDEVDWDEGYSGNIQYVLMKKAISTSVTTSPQGIEADNAGGSNNALPRSAPSLSNLTFIGDPTNSQKAIHLRLGTAALIYNSIFKDFPQCIDVDNTESNEQITAGSLRLVNAFTDCAAQFAPDSEVTGNDFGTNLLTTAGNSIMNGTITLDAAYAATEAAADNLTPVAPAAAGGTADTFFDQTNYAGAVEPGTDAGDAWWAGWTVPGSL
jgi:hypothetical protein